MKLQERQLQFYEFTDKETKQRFIIQAAGVVEAINRALLTKEMAGEDVSSSVGWDMAQVEPPFTVETYFDGHFRALEQAEAPILLH